VALLPGLDPAPMGWKSRAWYLGEHRERLFDRTGNIGPTAWWEGQNVGGWAQHKDGGEIVVGLFEDVGGRLGGDRRRGGAAARVARGPAGDATLPHVA
jgi:hypothetical protein